MTYESVTYGGIFSWGSGCELPPLDFMATPSCVFGEYIPHPHRPPPHVHPVSLLTLFLNLCV